MVSGKDGSSALNPGGALSATPGPALTPLWPETSLRAAVSAPWQEVGPASSPASLRLAWVVRDETQLPSYQVAPTEASRNWMDNLSDIPLSAELGMITGAGALLGYRNKMGESQDDEDRRLVTPASLEVSSVIGSSVDPEVIRGAVGQGNLTLLTDTYRGGLRTDLSLLVQHKERMTTPTTGTGTDMDGTLAGSPAYNAQQLYDMPGRVAKDVAQPPIPSTAAGATFGMIQQYLSWGHANDSGVSTDWQNLASFTRQPEPLLTKQGQTGFQLDSRSNVASLVEGDGNSNVQTLNGDPMRAYRMPRLLRVVYVYSYQAVPNGGNYDVRLVHDAFVTLWNPFDVPIRLRGDMAYSLRLHWGPLMRVSLRHSGASPSPVTYGPRHMDSYWAGNSFYFDAVITSPQDVILPPGATLVCGPTVLTLRDGTLVNDAGQDLDFAQRVINYQPLTNGYNYAGGIYSTRTGNNGPIQGPGTSQLEVEVTPRPNAAGFHTLMSFGRSVRPRDEGYELYPFRLDLLSQRQIAQGQNLTFGNLPKRSLNQATQKVPFASYIVERNDETYPGNPWRFTGFTRPTTSSPFSPGMMHDDVMKHRIVANPSGTWQGIQELQIGPQARAFYFTGRTPGNGLTHQVRVDVPETAPTSLLSLRNAGLGDGSFMRFRIAGGSGSSQSPLGRDLSWAPWVDQAFGNSWAHPLLPRDQIETQITNGTNNGNFRAHDHSYKLNRELADRYFLSGLDSMTGNPDPGAVWDAAGTGPANASGVAETGRLPNNPRLRFIGGNAEAAKAKLFTGTAPLTTGPEAAAQFLAVDGAFNVNSTSVDAWAAFFGSLRREGEAVQGYDLNGSPTTVSIDGTPVASVSQPLAAAPRPGPRGEAARGIRVLSDDEVRLLAEEMVKQVRLRGPFTSRAEFLNRRPVANDDYALNGALQAAIGAAGLNADLDATSIANSGLTGRAYQYAMASEQTRVSGSAGWVTQADLLAPLEPLLTVRGDTFTVRCVAQTSTQARRQIEITCQRLPEYLDPTQEAQTLPANNSPNARFGRRFKIIAWRDLTSEETLSPTP